MKKTAAAILADIYRLPASTLSPDDDRATAALFKQVLRRVEEAQRSRRRRVVILEIVVQSGHVSEDSHVMVPEYPLGTFQRRT